MKAKDTILKPKKIKELGWDWMLNYDYELKDVLTAQAEISFKAGYKQALKDYGIDSTTSGMVE